MNNHIQYQGNWVCWLVGHWWQPVPEATGERECARCLRLRVLYSNDRYEPAAVRDPRFDAREIRWQIEEYERLARQQFIDPTPSKPDTRGGL